MQSLTVSINSSVAQGPSESVPQSSASTLDDPGRNSDSVGGMSSPTKQGTSESAPCYVITNNQFCSLLESCSSIA